MNSITNTLAPNAANMIRLDHTHVLATFHQFKATSRPQIKRGLVNTTCVALEIHAQLEEEIFYPAVREVSHNEAIRKSVPEHDEMRRLIGLLREMEPGDPRYDDTYMELMRDVLHHVADEETVILPEAERLLQDQLGALGSRMMKRRMQLLAPRSGEIAVNMARATPVPFNGHAGRRHGGCIPWKALGPALKPCCIWSNQRHRPETQCWRRSSHL